MSKILVLEEFSMPLSANCFMFSSCLYFYLTHTALFGGIYLSLKFFCILMIMIRVTMETPLFQMLLLQDSKDDVGASL